MSRLNASTADPAGTETEPAHRSRIAAEAALLAAARAEIAAGHGVDQAEVDAWIDSIGTDRALRPRYPGR
jgi:predicted transcriptional regulator